MENFELDQLIEEINENQPDGYSSFISEKRLFVAVVNRAIKDLYSENVKLAQDARNWFESEVFDNVESLSFSFICHALDIDQKLFLAKLLQNFSADQLPLDE